MFRALLEKLLLAQLFGKYYRFCGTWSSF